MGFAIGDDAGYTRVADELIRQGAEGLIFINKDHAEWGQAEHELRCRIAPMRAAEYLVPILRWCSSGISQFIREGWAGGIPSAPFPGQDEMLFAQMELC